MKKYAPFLVVVHTLILVLAYSSPFWLDWRIIVVGLLVNHFQVLIAGGCVLSHVQFEDKDQGFHEWYLKKFGFKPNRRALSLILRYGIPMLILAVAIIFQVVGHVRVLVSF